MNKRLHELISNPNYLSSGEVYANLPYKKYCDELISVFGYRFVERLKEIENRGTRLESMPLVVPPKRYDEYTQVYVWGGRGSGKTCLLGSLFAVLAEECKSVKVCVEKESDSAVSRRFTRLQSSFFGGYFSTRLEDSCSGFQMYSMDCVPEGLLRHTHYPLSFIEALPDEATTNYHLVKLLKSPNNKIHLFCFDCSGTPAEQQQQAHEFCRLLEQLKDSLKTSVGLYVVVTKADTMLHVPAEFRHNAAQTLITAKYWQLWQQVVDACYEMNIYDSTPIPFSVGDVVLKDIITPNLTDARSLLHYPILLKSAPRPGVIKKILWSGGWKRTAFILLLILGGIIYALYAAFSIIPTPPLTKPVAYNFERDFVTRVQTQIPGYDFDASKTAYDNLRYELIVENNIRTMDGSRLIDVTSQCDSTLTNRFAEVVIKHYTAVYSRSDWYSKSSWLVDPGKYANLLCNSPVVANTLRSSLRKDLCRLKGYYDRVPSLTQMMELADGCRSWDDVVYVEKNYTSYQSYPYNNDKVISEFLSNAVRKSHESYSKYLSNSVKRCREKYKSKQEKQLEALNGYDTNSTSLDIIRNNIKNRIRKEYLNETRRFKDALDQAIEKAPETYKQLYKSVKSELEQNL